MKNREINYSFRKIFMFFLPFIIIGLLLIYVLANFKNEEDAMADTVKAGAYILANRLAYENHEPQRGEIILIEKDGIRYVRRIVGMPGDTIEFKKDSSDIIINSYVLSEDYVSSNTVSSTDSLITVPDNCYYILGDNRDNSIDSRYWEEPFITKDDIVGKVLFSYSIWEFYIDFPPEINPEYLEF